MVVPDNDPDKGMYMTLKTIENVLLNHYGINTGNRMGPDEVDQITATLRDGHHVLLNEVNLLLTPDPDGAPGLYCVWQYDETMKGDE